jgi:hypothetical protein
MWLADVSFSRENASKKWVVISQIQLGLTGCRHNRADEGLEAMSFSGNAVSPVPADEQIACHLSHPAEIQED